MNRCQWFVVRYLPRFAELHGDDALTVDVATERIEINGIGIYSHRGFLLCFDLGGENVGGDRTPRIN